MKFPEAEKDIKISDQVGIVMKYPPASLYSDKEFLASKGSALVDMLIEKSIDKIYEGAKVFEGDKMVGLKTWIDSLDVKTYGKINDFLTKLPSLNYELKYTNENGKERVITLSTLTDFFQL